MPMHWDGELRGVLTVAYRREHVVTNDQLKLLEAFGELAAAACRNASAHAGLVLAARTDGLTGCLNHAAMHEALRREIVRCERTGHRLSLVLVDMDDFKQVNEEHGHLVGDEVLRRVGHALRQAVRPYDLVARYGGDEFAVVTIDAAEEEASEVAGRALDGVRRSLDDLHAAPGATGASAGVAEWSPGQSSTELIEARRPRAAVRQAGGRARRGHDPAARGLPARPHAPQGREAAGAGSRPRAGRGRRHRGLARSRPRADRAPAQAHPAAVDGQRAGHAPGRHDLAPAHPGGRRRGAAPGLRLLPVHDRPHPPGRLRGERRRPRRAPREAGRASAGTSRATPG